MIAAAGRTPVTAAQAVLAVLAVLWAAAMAPVAQSGLDHVRARLDGHKNPTVRPGQRRPVRTVVPRRPAPYDWQKERSA